MAMSSKQSMNPTLVIVHPGDNSTFYIENFTLDILTAKCKTSNVKCKRWYLITTVLSIFGQ